MWYALVLVHGEPGTTLLAATHTLRVAATTESVVIDPWLARSARRDGDLR